MIDESVLRWFGHIERMEKERIAKRVYVGECVGNRLVDRPRKRWIDSVNKCLQRRSLNVGQARGMVYDMNEWQEFVWWNAWGIAWGVNP